MRHREKTEFRILAILDVVFRLEAALERERRDGNTVLFPIRLDDAVMDSDAAWAATIRRTRHIGDFTKWKDHDKYQKSLARLIRDLQADDKTKPAST